MCRCPSTSRPSRRSRTRPTTPARASPAAAASSSCSTPTASSSSPRTPRGRCTRSARSTTGSPSPLSGKYNEFENLRVAGVRLADLRGYSYDRRDVTGRGLANAYAQTLGTIFTETPKPYEVEIVVAEVGRLRRRRPALPADLRRLGGRRAGLRRDGRAGRGDQHGPGGGLLRGFGSRRCAPAGGAHARGARSPRGPQHGSPSSSRWRCSTAPAPRCASSGA